MVDQPRLVGVVRWLRLLGMQGGCGGALRRVASASLNDVIWCCKEGVRSGSESSSLLYWSIALLYRMDGTLLSRSPTVPMWISVMSLFSVESAG